MKKSTKIVAWLAGAAVVLGGTAILVGPRLYSAYADSVVDAPPALSPVESGEVVQEGEITGTWVVGGDSFAGYRVDEVLQGDPITVTGRTEEVEGSLTIDGLTLTEATISVDVASIATTEPARDAYFRGSALETEQFPTAEFTLTEPVTGSAPRQGEPQSFTVTGELTLHGVTKPASAVLEAVLSDDGGQVSGNIPITFSDFGVEAPSLGFVRVEETGFVEFLLDVSKE